MIRTSIYFSLTLIICSCSSPVDTIETRDKESAVSNEKKAANDTNAVKDRTEEAAIWLKRALMRSLDEDLKNDGQILTRRMKRYRDDQIETVYGDLTLDEFRQKWKSIYDVERSTRDNGLFIDAQDNGEIRILSCEASDVNKYYYHFRVKLRDELFEKEYSRDITLVEEKESFLIDEVNMVQ